MNMKLTKLRSFISWANFRIHFQLYNAFVELIKKNFYDILIPMFFNKIGCSFKGFETQWSPNCFQLRPNNSRALVCSTQSCGLAELDS